MTDDATPQPGAETLSLSDQMMQRRRKLDELRAAGVDPFGARVDDLVSTSSARAAFAAAGEGSETRVTLAGRLTGFRRPEGRVRPAPDLRPEPGLGRGRLPCLQTS